MHGKVMILLTILCITLSQFSSSHSRQMEIWFWKPWRKYSLAFSPSSYYLSVKWPMVEDQTQLE